MTKTFVYNLTFSKQVQNGKPACYFLFGQNEMLTNVMSFQLLEHWRTFQDFDRVIFQILFLIKNDVSAFNAFDIFLLRWGFKQCWKNILCCQVLAIVALFMAWLQMALLSWQPLGCIRHVTRTNRQKQCHTVFWGQRSTFHTLLKGFYLVSHTLPIHTLLS